MDSAGTLEGTPVTTRELQRLLDEAAIKRVHLDYCRGVDRRDWELVRSCYHPEAVDHHGPYSGGVDGFIEWALQFSDAVASTTHFVGNQSVDIDGDVAWHEAYCRAYHRIAATDAAPAFDWIVNLRYLDRMERREGEWKIADRLVVHDSDRRDLVAGSGETSPGWTRGGFGPDDPSYNRTMTWAELLASRSAGS